jgi:hypothetical protein
MKKRLNLTAVAVLAIATGGCTTTDGFNFIFNCEGEQTEHAVITYGASELKVMPPVLDVTRSKRFAIHLNPRPGFVNKNVAVAGVGADAGWVVGMGNKGDESKNIIVICVPDNTFIDQEYKYYVLVQDVGVLDPRVKVVE